MRKGRIRGKPANARGLARKNRAPGYGHKTGKNIGTYGDLGLPYGLGLTYELTGNNIGKSRRQCAIIDPTNKAGCRALATNTLRPTLG